MVKKKYQKGGRSPAQKLDDKLESVTGGWINSVPGYKGIKNAIKATNKSKKEGYERTKKKYWKDGKNPYAEDNAKMRGTSSGELFRRKKGGSSLYSPGDSGNYTTSSKGNVAPGMQTSYDSIPENNKYMQDGGDTAFKLQSKKDNLKKNRSGKKVGPGGKPPKFNKNLRKAIPILNARDKKTKYDTMKKGFIK